MGQHHPPPRTSIEPSTVRFGALARWRPSVSPPAITLAHEAPRHGVSHELPYNGGAAGHRPRQLPSGTVALYGSDRHDSERNGGGGRSRTRASRICSPLP